MSQSGDADDDLDDPFQLNFGDNVPRLENLQFLDPGINDLDCDFEEDCTYVDETTVDNNLSGVAVDLHLPLVTNKIFTSSIIVKPMCIKLVDCYKFPWYFDQFTKYIIEKKLMNVSVHNGDLMNVPSIKFRNVSDKCANRIVNSNTSLIVKDFNSSIMDVNANECLNENEKSVNKIGINRQYEMFCTNNNGENNKDKQLEKHNKRNNMEILRAIRLSNNTKVDLKKNIGFVGMKIQRITADKQATDVIEKPDLRTKHNKKRYKQNIKNKLYVQAVDKALSNIGTTMTPIFEKCAKNSGIGKCSPKDIKEDLSVTSFNNLTWNLEAIKETAVIDKKIKISEKEIYDLTKISEEIVRLAKPNEEKCHTEQIYKRDNKRKFCKERYGIENKHMKRFIKSSDIKQKTEDGSKLTKIISPIPLSLKARKIGKAKNKQEAAEIYETKPQISSNIPSTNHLNKYSWDLANGKNNNNYTKERYGLIPSRTISTKTNFPPQTSNPNMLQTLDKLSDNMLKIKTKKKLSKKNIPDKSFKYHREKPSRPIESKSTNKCKPLPSLPYETDKNILEIIDLDKSTSPKTSISYQQYSNKNHFEKSPKTNSDFPKHIEANTFSLNTSNKDNGKNDNISRCIPVENTLKETYLNNSGNQLKINIDNFSVKNKTDKKELTQQLKDKSGITVTKSPANHEGNMNNAAKTENFPIQTIISSSNKSGNRIHKTTNLRVQNDVQNTEVFTVIKPIQIQNHEAKMITKPFPVHNSMQAHILYRPQDGNHHITSQINANNPEAMRFQVPLHQMSQSIYTQPKNYLLYPTSYTKVAPHYGMPVNTNLSFGVNGIIPSQMDIGPPLGGNGAMKTRPHLGANATISRQKGRNARPPIINKNVLPQVASNAKGKGSAQMTMDVKYPGFNACIPQQNMAMNDIPIPQGTSTVFPGKVVWSLFYPPPKPPPPPPPLPPQRTSEFPITPQTLESPILGRNIDGNNKKDNITLSETDQRTGKDDKQDNVTQNIYSVSTPPFDELPPHEATTVSENTEITETKLEMMRELDKSISLSRQKVHDVSPTNLKRTLPTSDAKNAPSVKYKPGPLSKKIKFYNQEKANEQRLSTKGYSSPILPIPTFETILADTPYNNIFARTDAFSDKKMYPKMMVKSNYPRSFESHTKPKHFEKSSYIGRSKKISIDEYKNRSTNERRKKKEIEYHIDKIKANIVDKPRRASNVDSDLGYDSDSTVKL